MSSAQCLEAGLLLRQSLGKRSASPSTLIPPMRCSAAPPSGTEEEKHADCFAFLYRRKHSNYIGLLLQIIATDKVASTTTNSAMKRTEFLKKL